MSTKRAIFDPVFGFNPKQKVDNYPGLKLLMKKYEGSLKNLKTLTVVDGMNQIGWNGYLPYPLIDKDTVFIHPNQSDVAEGYVRIIYTSDKVISIFNILYFK
jgi:hypothetical protein